MKSYHFLSILIFFTALITGCDHSIGYGQNTFKAIIRDDKTKESLTGASATIPALKIGAIADTSGAITLKVPNGKFEVVFTFIGYNKVEKTLTFPVQPANKIIEIYLEPQGGELAEVTIQTTRTNQNLSDIATRIEALPAEELDEKGTMRPGDIKMLLQESTGINVQQTSAVSGAANVRI